ncbi:CBN-ABCX-1 protein [Caenorhabditis brenneri]|uniref:CBN-ABCX-1 protein n=1 Tax=Caenorhabditis brenneri TaxID=135651 RepID=G0MZQ4_CAEBE|nr:CBN-ABCX-1 protein [Caenorhabditis brenneri]
MSSEDVRIETSEEDESSGRDSIYFSTIRSRHADHFFADMHNHNTQNEKKGVFRYLEYDEIQSVSIKPYPNLLLNKLSFSKDLRSSSDKALLRLPVLKQEFHNVSLELTCADVMAVLYTKESEMLSFLRVICGIRDFRGKLSGDILINGHRMSRDRLEKTIAFVSLESPISTLTVRQYLHVNAKFRPPMTERYGGVGHLINKLMTDLGLIPVCDIICSRLNRSQWQRVKVASQLVRDPTILVCSDIFKDVDVHDQCFLIDYLREWAVKTNRIVIMAVSPPSIQVLKMFSKTLILASGRPVYFGPPKSMQQYFESVGCPCPPFKNVCDYYVDLVTHDNLTSDASRESSVRIARLVNKWNQTAPPIRRTASGKFLLDLPSAGILMTTLTVLRLPSLERVFEALFLPDKLLISSICYYISDRGTSICIYMFDYIFNSIIIFHRLSSEIYKLLIFSDFSFHYCIHKSLNYSTPCEFTTSQVTKGPCQKVSSFDLLSYYGFSKIIPNEKSNIGGFFTSNLLFGYLIFSFLLLSFSVFMFRFNRNKLFRKVSKI